MQPTPLIVQKPVLLRIISNLGQSLCFYSHIDWAHSRCDCEAGGVSMGNSKQNGCPEVRKAYAFFDSLTQEQIDNVLFTQTEELPFTEIDVSVGVIWTELDNRMKWTVIGEIFSGDHGYAQLQCEHIGIRNVIELPKVAAVAMMNAVAAVEPTRVEFPPLHRQRTNLPFIEKVEALLKVLKRHCPANTDVLLNLAAVDNALKQEKTKQQELEQAAPEPV